MFRKFWQLSVVIMFALLVSACSQECSEDCEDDGSHCQKECPAGNCVDADDWGYPKIWIPAGTEDGDLLLENSEGGAPSTGNSIFDSILGQLLSRTDYPNQTAIATDSGQVILDADKIPLVITVGREDQWTSWFGGIMNPKDDNGTRSSDGWDGGRIVPDLECQYSVKGVYPSQTSGSFADDLSPEVLHKDQDCTNLVPNADPLWANCFSPCYLRYGMGLYVGLAPGDSDTTTADDVVVTYHIPDSNKPGVSQSDANAQVNISSPVTTGTSITDILMPITKAETSALEARGMDGYLVRGFASQELPGAETRDKLYFKIIDNYYSDNQGGYMVRIKEGTRSSKPGPLEWLTDTLLEPVFVVMRRLYEGVVTHQSYIQGVRAVLALYIVFYGFVFMMGGIEEAKKAVQFRILKIAVIVQVISPGSFDFFYNHMFKFFMEGVMGIAGLLVNPFGDYDPANPWYSMDLLLAKFFSAETSAKVFSTLFSNIPLGILAVIVIYAAIILFVIALFKAVLIYIVGFIGMAILVVLFPIFIIFMLFDKTKELFKEITDQFLAISIQEIVLLASLGMFAAIIVGFLERTIGYRVCFNTWADFDFFGTASTHLFGFKFWMPDISYSMSNLWVDADGDGVRQLLPPEMAYRYIDLPYLDPTYDSSIIARYMSGTNFLEIGDIAILAAATFLMMLFMDFVPTLSDSLKGGGSADQESASLLPAGGKLFQSSMGIVKQGIGDSWGAIKEARSLAGKIAATDSAGRAGRAMKRGGAQAMSAAGGKAKELAGEGVKRMPGTDANKAFVAGKAKTAFDAMKGDANKLDSEKWDRGRRINKPSTLEDGGDYVVGATDGSHMDSHQQHEVNRHQDNVQLRGGPVGTGLTEKKMTDVTTTIQKTQEEIYARTGKTDKEDKKASADAGKREVVGRDSRDQANREYEQKAARENEQAARDKENQREAAAAAKQSASDAAAKQQADSANAKTIEDAKRIEAQQVADRAKAKQAEKARLASELSSAQNELAAIKGQPGMEGRVSDLEKKIQDINGKVGSAD